MLSNGIHRRPPLRQVNTHKGSSTLTYVAFAMLIPLGVFHVLEMTASDDMDPEYFSVEPVPFEGGLFPNDDLLSAERLYEGRLKGAESLVLHDGHIYSGTSDGKIVDIHGDTIRTVAMLGRPPCGTAAQEKTCGRPLGMRMGSDGNLVVVDSYLGVFKVNPRTGFSERILVANLSVGGVLTHYLNDVDIASDGTLYITDSSTKWSRAQGMDLILESRPTGRLFRFNPATNQTDLLISHSYCANGVQLSPDEDFVLLTESGRCRILRYYLKGDKAGTYDVFAELPGFPDNVRPSSSGGYWVAIAIVNNPDKFPVYKYFGWFPRLRRVMNMIFGQEFMLKLIRTFYGMVIQLDKDGKIVRSFHDPTGSHVVAVSEVAETGSELYLGSFFSPYMIKLDLNKVKPTNPYV